MRIHHYTCCFTLPLLVGLSATETWAADTPAPKVQESQTKRSKRGLLNPEIPPLWSNNTVYYVLTNASPAARQKFLQAAQHISENSALRFVEHTDQPNYLYISSDNIYAECSSLPNPAGGPQHIGISSFCQDPNSILHETLHALGLMHEHQRPDRDHYLRFNPEYANDCSYKKLEGMQAIGDYDYQSVTHYPPETLDTDAFSIIEPNIRIRPMAQRGQLSAGDIATLQHAYPTQARQTPPTALSDNGLSVRLSKRTLKLTPNTRASIDLWVPSHLQLDQVSSWSEHPDQVELTKRGRHGNRFTLKLKAKALSHGAEGSRLFFRFKSGERVGTAIMKVQVVEPENAPKNTLQLVSHQTRQCLSAEPINATGLAQRFLRYDLAWQHKPLPELKLVQASCDGDDPMQFWTQKPNGLLSVLGRCLSLNDPLHPSMVACPSRRETEVDSRLKWRIQQGRVIHDASNQALQFNAAGNPEMEPTTVGTTDGAQTWDWF